MSGPWSGSIVGGWGEYALAHGSFGTSVDLQEVFELHASGLTTVHYEKRKLDDVNEALHQVEEAAVKARLVFDLT